MALIDIYKAIYENTDFEKRVSAACFIAARDILVEDAGTANHANRIIWATAAQKNCKAMGGVMVVDVLKNGTIAADVAGASDNDIQFVVNSLVDTYATGE